MSGVNLEQAEKYLIQLSDILISSGASLSWADRLHSVASKRKMSAEDFRLEVKGLYGGMGSLNDLVICDAEGKMDRNLNVQFDEIRSKLFGLL